MEMLYTQEDVDTVQKMLHHLEEYQHVVQKSEPVVVPKPASNILPFNSTPVTGISLSREIINSFSLDVGVGYAIDKNGALYLSNGHFVIKTNEKDINSVMSKINARRSKHKLEHKLSERILTYFGDDNGNYKLSAPPVELDTEHGTGLVFADEKQYFQYNKKYMDFFSSDKVDMFVNDNTSSNVRNHQLIIRNSAGDAIGLVMPVQFPEKLYEQLADKLPLEIPWKSQRDEVFLEIDEQQKQAEPQELEENTDDIAQDNYNTFALAFPQVIDGSLQGQIFVNEETNQEMHVYHNLTTAGHIYFEISTHTLAPDAPESFEPVVTFQADFENRMLTPIKYANSITGENIGYESESSPDDEQRLQVLSSDISELLSNLKNQGFKLVHSEPFKDSMGNSLPIEPRIDIESFLEDIQQELMPVEEQTEQESTSDEPITFTVLPNETVLPTPVLPTPSTPKTSPVPVLSTLSTPKTPTAPVLSTPSIPKTPPPPNFRITDDKLGEGGAKAKYHNNITAINLLKELETVGRNATPEEQEILSRYVGWGGIPQVFDDRNAQWENEYKELFDALSLEDYNSARESVLNAHYTSPLVIKAMYETIERLGFKQGNLLEPSMGIGGFFGLLPENMSNAKLYGVEIDSISARIATQLYPNSTINAMGFEETDYPDSFFDIAVGNVPFGAYGVSDKRYDKHKFNIHDYFFAKTLDQVRPGGIVAFITSKGTLDKQNPDVRKYLAQRAELLGAVRLPNNAFLKNAGTEVTADIIFLQKRERMIDIVPDWVHLGQTDDGIAVNRYFADNPEMILGTMSAEQGKRMYGNENATTCVPIEGADLAEQLKSALFNVQGKITEVEIDDLDGTPVSAIPASPNVKNFSYTVVDNKVYFRENSMMYPVEQPATTLERIKGMVGLRDCVRELIDLQVNEHSEGEIKAKQAELDSLYNKFTKNYGLINASANNRAFATGQFSDNAYYLLCSLEIIDEDGKLKRKGDMFTKRTIKQKNIITRVDTASEALAVSLGEKAKVDIDYMCQLTGMDEQTIEKELRGVIFRDTGERRNSAITDGNFPFVTADEYLSGNIREKINTLKNILEEQPELSERFSLNLFALEKAMPKELEAHEINLRLGTTWIDPKYVQEFMYELLQTSPRNQGVYQIKYHNGTGEWQVSGRGKAPFQDILATVTHGTKRMNAYEIIHDTLNLRDSRVYDYKRDADGKEQRVLNKKETTLVQQKQEQIKRAFKEWIFKDPVFSLT